MMSQAVVSNVRGVEERVRLEYKEHFRVASQKVDLSDGSSSTLVDSAKEQYFSFTSRSAKTEIGKANEGGQSYQILLAAVYDVVTLISAFRVSSWSLIHVCAYLLSPRGRPVLAGLCNVQGFDFSRRVRIVKYVLKKTLQGCSGEVLNITVFNVAAAAELLADFSFAGELQLFTESTPHMAAFSHLFLEVRQRLWDSRPRAPIVGRMRLPDLKKEFKDVLRLRFLTFLYFPPEASVSAYELAKAGFVYTGVKDLVCCTKCEYKSADLQGSIEVTSYKFHVDGCPSIREARLSFRVNSYAEFPVRSRDVRNKLATNGLFYIGTVNSTPFYKYMVMCYKCCKKTDYRKFASEPSEWHQPLCFYTAKQEQDVPLQESIARLSRIVCNICNDRSANVLTMPCCHLTMCSRCYTELPRVVHCLKCQGNVERCFVLY